MQVKTYLILTGVLAAAYTGYTIFNKPTHTLITKDLTKRISQQIKHQMMIVCITYSKAMKKIRQDNKEKFVAKAAELLTQFRSEISQVYLSKENLILRKYSVTRETYGRSLEKFKNDKQIGKNITEIFEMMQRSLDGKLPDFTVPKEAQRSFSKDQLAQIYKQMVTLIGKKVTTKLQMETLKNPKFNPASDDDFRNAIRQLSIYDIKVEFLQQKGFKVEWGCANQVFFKCLQNQKSKDQDYQKKIVAYEKTYQKVIQIVSNDPHSLSDQQIDNMFKNALNQAPPVKPKVNPVTETIVPKKTTVIPAVVKPQPKKQQMNQDDLEKLMMQQLLNRSQQQPQVQKAQVDEQKPKTQNSNNPILQQQPEQIIHSEKVGLTQEQVKQEGPQQGVNTKMQEATEQIQIAEDDSKLYEKEQETFEAIVNVSEQKLEESQDKVEQIQPQQEQALVNAEQVEKSQVEHIAEQQQQQE